MRQFALVFVSFVIATASTSAQNGWTVQNSNTGALIRSVESVNSQVGWVCADGATIRRTINGGATWQAVSCPVSFPLSIAATDSLNALVTTSAFGVGAEIYRTTDGGSNWTLTFNQLNGFLVALIMIDRNMGFGLGIPVDGRWTLLKTTNAGIDWTRFVNEPLQIGTESGWTQSFATISGRHFWFGASNARVYHSSDGGASWTSSVSTSHSGVCTAVSFADSLNGVAAFGSGGVAYSSDGGTTWNAVTIPGVGPVWGITTDHDRTFWLPTLDTVFVSTNLGRTWQSQFANPFGAPLRDIHFSRDEATISGWVGSANGGIARYSRTTSSQPGDTLYSFVIPNQLILGVARIARSQRLAFTSGGQISGTTTSDNKWIVTTLNGSILDTTRLQRNPTSGQGFGFRDLAWDGRWLLTADNSQVRRIDTATFTEIVPRISGPGTLQRGIAWETVNRMWKANSNTDPIIKFDTAGTIMRNIGSPANATYGLAFDKWTSRNRGYLWYSEVLGIGLPVRLSKVDTATGAILQSFEYNSSLGIAGGLDIFVGHPSYPGRVIAALVAQNFPNSRCIMIDLGPDSSTATSVTQSVEIPHGFRLLQNYPNPFNPSTTIKFSVEQTDRATLNVYNILGQHVATLFDEVAETGQYYNVHFDASRLASGMYMYRLHSGKRSELKKLLHLK